MLLRFTFTISDFLGRWIPSAIKWFPSHTVLLLLAIARLVMLEVLFAVCSIKGAGEAVFFILTFLLGITNGQLTTLMFMAACRGLNPSVSEMASNIAVFCNAGGLTVGAYLGWLWTVV